MVLSYSKHWFCCFRCTFCSLFNGPQQFDANMSSRRELDVSEELTSTTGCCGRDLNRGVLSPSASHPFVCFVRWLCLYFRQFYFVHKKSWNWKKTLRHYKIIYFFLFVCCVSVLFKELAFISERPKIFVFCLRNLIDVWGSLITWDTVLTVGRNSHQDSCR